jgi:hypothetical protein
MALPPPSYFQRASSLSQRQETSVQRAPPIYQVQTRVAACLYVCVICVCVCECECVYVCVLDLCARPMCILCAYVCVQSSR